MYNRDDNPVFLQMFSSIAKQKNFIFQMNSNACHEKKTYKDRYILRRFFT